MHRTVSILPIAIASLVLAAGTAHAAPITGHQTDPANPGLLDITSVDASFDPGNGHIEVAFHGRDLNGIGHTGLELAASLSAPNPDGVCDTIMRPGDVRIQGFEGGRSTGSPDGQWAAMYDHGTQRITMGGCENAEQVPEGPRLSVESGALIGRNLRCVSGVYGERSQTEVRSRDDVEAFTVGGPVVAPPVAVVAPAAITVPAPVVPELPSAVAPVAAASVPTVVAVVRQPVKAKAKHKPKHRAKARKHRRHHHRVKHRRS